MLKLSNFKSSKSHIAFNIQVESDAIASMIPEITSTDELKTSFFRLSKELAGLQIIVSHGGINAIENYREERAEAIRKLTENTRELFATIENYRLKLKASLNEKLIQQEYASAMENIEALAGLKNEYEILAALNLKIIAFTKLASANFEKKIRFYKYFHSLVKGELKAGITLDGEYDYTFGIYELGKTVNFDNAAQAAVYQEFMTIDIGIPLSKMIGELMDKKRVLKKLMVDKFNPWDSFEEVLTVEEFLRGRAEVANFWNEEFSFTENLAHHYFKSQGFYQFFEERLMEKLNSIRSKIDAKVNKIQTQYEINENVLALYGNMTVSQFINGSNLRLVSAEGLPKPRHHSFNILKSINEKLASIVWNETEKNIARKLGGIVASPGVIIRPNRQDNKATMKSELIVISNQNNSEDPKTLLNGKFSDLISTKSEKLTEFVEIEHRPDGLTIDLDIKLSYFLTTSRAA